MITPPAWRRFFAFSGLCLLALPQLASAATVQAWLLLSGDWRDSVISTDSKEKDTLASGGWKISGTGLLQTHAQAGAAALHRLARAGTNATDRMLETDPAKVAALVKDGFTDEGVLGYVSSQVKPGLVPVFHFTKESKHFWTIDPADKAAAEEHGWKADGTAFWLWPASDTTIKVPAMPPVKKLEKP